MYEAIGVFTPGRFRDDFLDKAKGDHEKALAAYLQSGLGRPICADEVTRWRGLTADAGKVLAERLDEPPDLLSCSEEPLLAVPRLDPLPGSTADVDSLLKGYQAAVLAADREDDGFFLVALAEYGRRYDMIIEVEVPLLEPSTIKIEEDLPLELSWRNRMSHSFAFGDARSAHLEARVSDPAVEIADFDLHDLQDHDASGWIESVRQTREAVSIYSSEPGRPYFVRVRLRFRAARYLLVTTVLLALANVVALVAMLLVEQDGSYVDRLVVLSLPTTVAAAFVLIREQTALATRLQWPTRAFLAATTLAVWGVLVGMTVTYNAEADAGGPERPVDSTKSGGPALSKYHSMGKDQGTWPRTGHEVADE